MIDQFYRQDQESGFDKIKLNNFIQPLAKPNIVGGVPSNRLIRILLKKVIYLNEKIKEKLFFSKEKKFNKILFINFEENIKKDPLFKEMKKQKVNFSILTCSPLSKTVKLKSLKSKYNFYSSCTKKVKKQSRYYAKRLSSNHTNHNNKNLDFFSSFETLYILFRNYLTFKRIIQKNNIKAVLLTSLFGVYETPLLLCLSKLNKKIFFYPHGYGWRNFKIINKNLTKNIFFLASGNEEKNVLLKSGIKRKNIHITGSPLFDLIPKFQPIKPHQNRITFLTQPLVEDEYVNKKTYFNYIKKFLFQIKEANEGCSNLIIKLHPREKFQKEYWKIMKSLKINGKILQTSDKNSLYDLIAKSTLLISFGSTTDIEGIMLNKNIVNIDGFKGEIIKKDKFREAVITINKDDNLTKTIAEILNNHKLQKKLKQKRTKYLKENFYKLDGQAHQRITKIISKLIKND